MRRIQAGEQPALDEALSLHWSALHRYAARLLNCDDAAEDAVQMAYVRLWERRGTWEPASSLTALLYRITRNLVLNEKRRRAVRTRWWKRLSGGGRTAPGLTPAEAAEASELRDAISDAIAALPERRREVFVLARYHGLSYREIADAMELSPQTVANQMSSALSQLRTVLRPYKNVPISGDRRGTGSAGAPESDSECC